LIANARMYSVSPQTTDLWRALLGAVIARADTDIQLLEHPAPAPLEDLWGRPDLAAVFMCGLPFSKSERGLQLIAAPVPSPAEFRGLPQYWSELVVRNDSAMHTLEDTFGRRIALTVPDSQSGCLAALSHLMGNAHQFPVYSEVVTPRITPLGVMSAVIEGEAEVAPIDAYAYRLLQKYRGDLTSQLRVVARTAPTAIPALVASSGDFEALQAAFLEAHEIPAIQPLMAGLLLQRFVRPDPRAYEALRVSYESATRYWRDKALAATLHPAFVFG
jgi:ABC-type phosphate/phosphonate transport system substrate-binding protein